MPIWAWVLTILLSLTGLLAILLACVRLRYHLEGDGMWTGRVDESHARGAIRVEFRFPGVRKVWEPLKTAPSEASEKPPQREPSTDTAKQNTQTTAPHPRTESVPQRVPPASPVSPASPASSAPQPEATAAGASPDASADDRKARALFLLATDTQVWGWARNYGLRVMVLVFRLLDPRVEAAIGHPDPALLGRTAGKWYAVRPLLPTDRATLGFRFEDRHPSLRFRLDGGLSALSLAFFGIRLLWAFPAVRLGRRAWRYWRHPNLSGWRDTVYRRVHERERA